MNDNRLVLELPNNLKRDFKMACVANDKSMSEVIRKLMQEYIDKNKPS